MSTGLSEFTQPGDIELLDRVITYIESTDPSAWWAGPTHRSPDGTQHCVLSHVFEHFGLEGMAQFEEAWATSYSIGSVNDAPDIDYPQPTPKERSLAYLHALRAGTQMSTRESMERDYQRSIEPETSPPTRGAP